MNIHTGNIKTYLTGLTLAQLRSYLAKVQKYYVGYQINALTQEQYDSWQTHLSLIESEIDRRGDRP